MNKLSNIYIVVIAIWFCSNIMATERFDLDDPNSLSSYYEYGKECRKQSPDKAMEIFIECYEHGIVDALAMQGLLYIQGDGVDVNYEKAKYLLEKALSQGSNVALGLLAVIYADGLGVEPDIEKANQYRSKAAYKGDKQSMFYLGLASEFGQGVDIDYQKAAYWYKKSDLTYALLRYTYLVLEERVLDMDKRALVKYINNGIKENRALAYALRARLHYKGYILAQDLKKAKMFYEKSIELGSDVGKTDYGLALISTDGLFNRDMKRGIDMLIEASNNGHGKASYCLGVIMKQEGKKEYTERVIEYYKLAAWQGYPEAKTRLRELNINIGQEEKDDIEIKP
ncbi:MAG: tetratricopeptide repeat protein [Sedimentisphaeraceae bacterium JB056]